MCVSLMSRLAAHGSYMPMLLAACVFCACVSCGLTCLAMSSRDPYADLPKVPPGMREPLLQGVVDFAFATRSRCYEFNAWARVTVPEYARLVEDIAASLPAKLTDAQRKTAELRVADAFGRMWRVGATQFSQCGADSMSLVDGGNSTLEGLNAKIAAFKDDLTARLAQRVTRS